MHADTSKPKGTAFRTKAGHVVYGGGGIAPDIFIPFDTTAQPKEALQLYIKEKCLTILCINIMCRINNTCAHLKLRLICITNLNQVKKNGSN